MHDRAEVPLPLLGTLALAMVAGGLERGTSSLPAADRGEDPTTSREDEAATVATLQMLPVPRALMGEEEEGDQGGVAMRLEVRLPSLRVLRQREVEEGMRTPLARRPPGVATPPPKVRPLQVPTALLPKRGVAWQPDRAPTLAMGTTK